jgi:cytochrome c peroxidase/serine/threonine protein kinase
VVTGDPPRIPAEGDVVAGKYRVERILGKGGMGLVVAAEHLSLGQLVAVKFLLPEALERAESRERFVREARAAAAIQNEHVAKILDVGIQESGAPYIVMEYLTGRDLGDLLRERGPLPSEEAVGYVLEACVAMAEAHARGIVHRDLKPSNLFLASSLGGPVVVKILDFGLAKALPVDASGSAEDSLTATNVVMGSIHYMSPEQMRSLKHADVRSDIWSLGVILYELVAGHRPFQGDSLPASLMMIGLDPPPPIDSEAVPPDLEKVIMRCLEKDPGRRPQTVAELAVLLGPFGGESARASVDRIAQFQAAQPPNSREILAAGSGLVGARPRVPTPTPIVLDGGANGLAETRTQLGPAVSALPPTARAPVRAGWRARLLPRSRPLLWIASAAALAAVAVVVVSLARGWFESSPADIEADRLASFSPLPTVAPPADPVARRRIELGARLFADPRLSRDDDIACTSCHPLDRHGADGLKLSRGTGDLAQRRNTLGIYNVSGFFALLWDGRHDDLSELAKEVLQSPRLMAASQEGLPRELAAVPEYSSRFAAAFPDDAQPVSFDNTARALAAYQETLFSRGRWDRFLEGDQDALNDEEKAGFNRFVEVGCVTCHFGPNVGATMFQKVGLVKAWPDSKDRGRYEITRRDVDWMVFRVPTLRNVEKTGPYFHDGSVADLDVAIERMAWHQLGKEIDGTDVRLIRRWLATLTGEPVRAAN